MSYPLVEKGLAELTRQVIHRDVVEPRKCWEVSTPTTQCNNIIGAFKDNTPCYICGMAIKKASTKSKASNDDDYVAGDGLNPECEHILPIAEAIIYLGLESPQFRKNPWYIRNILNYEYAWAHRTCNQVKSDTSYIVKDATGNFVVDIAELKKLLTDIWNTKRKDSVAFKESLKAKYKTIELFKAARIGSNNGPVIEPFQTICGYLNSFNAPNLVLLAGVCGISNIAGKKSAYAREMQAKRNDPNYFKKQEEDKLKSNTERFNTMYNEAVKQILPELNRICNPSRYPAVYSQYNALVEKERAYFITIMRQASQESKAVLTKFIKVSLIQLFLEAYRSQESTNIRGITLGEKQMRKNESMLPNVFKKATTALSRKQFSNQSTEPLSRKRPRNNNNNNNNIINDNNNNNNAAYKLINMRNSKRRRLNNNVGGYRKTRKNKQN
jgi:hypothetical protein